MRPLGARKTKSIVFGGEDAPVEWAGIKSGRSAVKRDASKEMSDAVEELRPCDPETVQAGAILGARPLRAHVDGSPFQPGDEVVVIDAIDRDVHDLSEYIGQRGQVEYLEYSCGCGQHYPDDPMIGVRLACGKHIEFWPEELQLVV